MKDIIKEIEYCSAKIKELESKYNLAERQDMNLLMWKWHEKRRGMIEACRLLGIKVEIVDREGLKWAVTGAAE